MSSRTSGSSSTNRMVSGGREWSGAVSFDIVKLGGSLLSCGERRMNDAWRRSFPWGNYGVPSLRATGLAIDEAAGLRPFRTPAFEQAQFLVRTPEIFASNSSELALTPRC